MTRARGLGVYELLQLCFSTNKALKWGWGSQARITKQPLSRRKSRLASRPLNHLVAKIVQRTVDLKSSRLKRGKTSRHKLRQKFLAVRSISRSLTSAYVGSIYGFLPLSVVKPVGCPYRYLRAYHDIHTPSWSIHFERT